MDDVRIPLPEAELTATDETDLARRIEAGVIAAAIRRGHAFGGAQLPASDAELIMVEQLGADAEQRFVEQNLRLVAMVSRREAARTRMAEADLFQEGCLGLLEAVRRFDHRREIRFATYALYWIRAYVNAWSANRAGELNVPASRAERVRGVRGAQAQLAQQLGRKASDAEVASAIGRSTTWVRGVLDFRPPSHLDHQQLRDLELVDSGASRDLDSVLEDRMPGREMLAGLSPVQRQIIEWRFGFVDGLQRSYRDTSRLVGVPLSTVRREEERALDCLRAVCPQQAIVHLAS